MKYKVWCFKNFKGKEVICKCEDKPFDYLETVLKFEENGILPKGVYSSDAYSNNGWCNDIYANVPYLDGIIVPDGTFEKLGIKYEGEPIELKNYDNNDN